MAEFNVMLWIFPNNKDKTYMNSTNYLECLHYKGVEVKETSSVASAVDTLQLATGLKFYYKYFEGKSSRIS